MAEESTIFHVMHVFLIEQGLNFIFYLYQNLLKVNRVYQYFFFWNNSTEHSKRLGILFYILKCFFYLAIWLDEMLLLKSSSSVDPPYLILNWWC